MAASANVMRELWDFFFEQSRPRRNALSVSFNGREITFGAMFDAADRLAVRLYSLGLKEGSVVGLLLPNSLAFVPAFLALTKLASVVTLISPKYGRNELQAIVRGISPTSILTFQSYLPLITSVLGDHPTAVIDLPGFEENLVLISYANEQTNSQVSSAAVIKFTSGSTGEPKGIPLSVENVIAECTNIVETLMLTELDRILAPVPLFHSYGFDLGVLASLASGAGLVVQDSFVPRRTLKELSGNNITVFLGVPSMYKFMIDAHNESAYDLSHVRYLLSCTAPLSPEVILGFHRTFGVPVCQHYGSSETGAVTTHVPAHVLDRPESVGVPMENVRVTILDSDGKEFPAGTEGEVAVTSDAMAQEYLMGQTSGKSPFRDGSFHTGDRGMMDADGFLYLHGRLDDLINVGGLKVSPSEVIHVLESFPAVREAAVIGVKDVLGEEFVYALVSLKQASNEKDILVYCRSRLAEYKVPRRIEIRDELPRGASGKINIRVEDLRL